MKKPAVAKIVQPLTLDDARVRARSAAVEGEPRRSHDKQFNRACWVLSETPERAVIVYDDEPHITVRAKNYEGRFPPPLDLDAPVVVTLPPQQEASQ
jgi:hypothetical protein